MNNNNDDDCEREHFVRMNNAREKKKHIYVEVLKDFTTIN